jgi:DNA-damage-inducible protein D
MSNVLVPFEGKHIRSIEHEGETWFSVVDIIEILTESPNPRNYWKVLKNREPQLVTVCNQLKLAAKDGKKYATDCANSEGVLRIIQSVPSPKAEPFKMWLAQTGVERIEETENPELGFERLRDLYRAKGYADEWITNRLKSIDIRKQLTDEWKKRGVKEGQEYAILTADIAKETFGLSPSEHAQVKGLEKQNLRDHMTNLELIFTALGEELTRVYTVKDDAQGFVENQYTAQKGGRTAGLARERVEKETGDKIVSATNFLKKQDDESAQLPEE